MTKSAPTTVFRVLLGCILLLLILHIISFVNFYNNGLSTEEFFFRKLNFNEEKNLPSIFSSALHFISGLLLFSIAIRKFKIEKKKFFWFSLAFVFIYLGLDELLRLHEKLSRLTSNNLEVSGLFEHAWVIPYGIALIVLGIFYFKSLIQLPKRTVRFFVIAGAIFVFGALILEMVAGWYIDTNNIPHTKMGTHTTLPIVILYTIEETLEMLGISIFIFELLRFKRDYTYSNSEI